MANDDAGATKKVAEFRPRGSMGQSQVYRDKYPPEAFIMPGQDHNGQSVRLYCQVPPIISREVDKVFDSRKFPFIAKGDVLRWMVFDGLRKLEALEPVEGSLMVQIEAMLTILKDEQQNHAFMTVFNNMSTTISMHIQAQAMGEARRLIHQMTEMVGKVGNAYWRGRCEKELKDRFGHLLDSKLTEGAGLQGFADGVDED